MPKNDFKSLFTRLEGNARRQIKALTRGAEQGLTKIPIGPGPLGKLLKGVRMFRREMNGQLGKLDRALVQAIKDAKAAQRGR